LPSRSDGWLEPGRRVNDGMPFKEKVGLIEKIVLTFRSS